MKKSPPLLTVMIISYNNGNFLFETLESTLAQDYENMELIISDDCSEQFFDAEKIIDYINVRRTDRLKRVIINENERNLGTVRHLEFIRPMARGELELVIAADDVWHDSHVFSALVERMEELGPDAEWLVSQMEMCDENLDKTESLFVPDDVVQMIEKKQYEELLNKEVTGSFLPSSSCMYRRSFYNKIKNLSEYYCLIEDYTSHLRGLSTGIPIYYLNRISVRHRSGGISHGNLRNGNIGMEKFYRDLYRTFELEIAPIRDRLNASAYRIAQENYLCHQACYEKLHIQEIPQSPPTLIKKKSLCLHQCRAELYRIKPTLLRISGVEFMKKTVAVLLCFLFSAALLQQSRWLETSTPGCVLLRTLIILLFLFLFGQFLLNCLLKLWEKSGVHRGESL